MKHSSVIVNTNMLAVILGPRRRNFVFSQLHFVDVCGMFISSTLVLPVNAQWLNATGMICVS